MIEKISDNNKATSDRQTKKLEPGNGYRARDGIEPAGRSNINYTALMEPVARYLWGAPKTRSSTELRWGTRGSRAVDLTKGTWYDHERGAGGGVLDLVIRETSCDDKKAARQWLSDNHFIEGGKGSLGKIVATYGYQDRNGKTLFEVLRYEPKDFRQRRPDGHGGFIWGLGDTRRVLYRLPRLLKAVKAGQRIYIVEGEKDVRALHKLGLAATTNPGGAMKWRDEYSNYLEGADCVLLPDNDDPGRAHVADVAAKLHGVAGIRIVDLAKHWPQGAKAPERGADVRDWFEAGGTAEQLEQIAEATPEWEPDGDAGNVAAHPKAAKQADVLIAIAADGAELFHAPDSVAYADVRIADHRETWPIRSWGFKRWLLKSYYEATESAPNSEAVATALNIIEAKAHYDGETREVYVRVIEVDDKIYLDLCDEHWRVVEIDKRDWRVLDDDSPVRFRRRHGMLALPVPEKGGSVRDLKPYVNVKSFSLFVSYLLAALRGRGPYPLLILLGEAGAAKSTALRLVKALVDPNKAPLRAPPRENRDVYIAANNSRLVALDNLSYLPDWLSDTLCRLATGGGFGTRELYTDEEEKLFDAMRPVALTAIENVVVLGDLADRSIFLTLTAIPDDRRRRERELWASFEADRPRILGALLDALAHGLRALPETKLDGYPRMADFAEWATACEGGLPWKAGTFARAYATNRARATADIIEADIIAKAVAAFIEQEGPWEGETQPLLDLLTDRATEDQRNSKHWPKAANALSGKLTRAASALRKIGIEVKGRRDPKTWRRIWNITQAPTNPENDPWDPRDPRKRRNHKGFRTKDAHATKDAPKGQLDRLDRPLDAKTLKNND